VETNPFGIPSGFQKGLNSPLRYPNKKGKLKRLRACAYGSPERWIFRSHADLGIGVAVDFGDNPATKVIVGTIRNPVAFAVVLFHKLP
jgi:hypothetical protein